MRPSFSGCPISVSTSFSRRAEERVAVKRVSGRWRITEMDLWDNDTLDLLGPAFITFNKTGTGELQFIAVEGDLDCRHSLRDGQPFVEFSWVGDDDGHPTSGRGWASVNGDTLVGEIFIHLGDSSKFRGQAMSRR